jgi:hypothetical protein
MHSRLIAAQIATVAVALLAIAAIALVLHYRDTSRSNRALLVDELYELRRLDADVERLISAARRYALVGNEADRKTYKQVELQVAASRERALAMARERFLDHTVAGLERSIEGVVAALSGVIARGTVTGTDGAMKLEDAIASGRRNFDTQLTTIEQHLREQVTSEHARAREATARGRWVLVGAAAIVLALGAAFVIALRRALRSSEFSPRIEKPVAPTRISHPEPDPPASEPRLLG